MSESYSCNDVEIVFVDEKKTVMVSSHVLSLASPTFAAMVKTGDGRAKRMEISRDVGTREEFQKFYDFLLPVTSWDKELSEKNIDGVLTFSEYYNVKRLKEVCEKFLMARDMTPKRLLQAKKNGLTNLHQRCLRELSSNPYTDMTDLKADVDLCLEVIAAMQVVVRPILELEQSWSRVLEMRDSLERAAKEHTCRVCGSGDRDLKLLLQELIKRMPKQQGANIVSSWIREGAPSGEREGSETRGKCGESWIAPCCQAQTAVAEEVGQHSYYVT